MPQITMRVIQEPEHDTRSVIRPNSLPVFVGDGSVDYLCGDCGEAIARGMREDTKFSNLVVLCTCGSYNEWIRGDATMRKTLRNKPLVEAIFELRWVLSETPSGVRMDPHYKILIGGIYDRVKSEYPVHEQLPTATIADEIAAYVVQHRFRKDRNRWPLIQLGPGIITLNDTDGYTWEDFEERISRSVDALFEAYPESVNLEVDTILLRYIDAVDFDYERSKIFTFLKDKMKVNVDIHKELFEDTGVSSSPLGFDLRFSFTSAKPKGAIQLRFARGIGKGADALIWETMVQSIAEDIPKTKTEITAWVEEAHNLIDDWFFKIIEGELLRRFE